MKVVSKAAKWVEKSGTLMAWAVTAQSRKATYIGSLSREQTGLKCECICPACGGELQAVNAGRPSEYYLQENTLRPFFRHHSGQQNHGCLVRVAQLAALQLLLSKNEIDLPAPKATRSVLGASGTIYKHEATGDRMRYKVVDRIWIDEQEARITLDDGRVVLIRLFGSSKQNEDGLLDAIITIRIDDPEVSTWPPDKILEKAELTDDWLCWDRHWQDSQLNDEAQAKAEADAFDHLDLIPNGLILPDGMSPLQRSESVLHWTIKDMLAKAGNILAPEYIEVISKVMPSGREIRRVVKFPAMQLILSDVRVEFGITGMTPDILCRAQNFKSNADPFDLMIEVAVTHKVDSVKKQRIENKGLACLELDVGLLKRSGRVLVKELHALVCKDPSNKVWINHPEIQKRRASALSELQDIEIQDRKIQESNEQREQWFAELSDSAALQEYLGLVRQRWSNQKTLASNGTIWDLSEMAARLAARGFSGLTEDIFWSRGSLLWKLDSLRESCRNGNSAQIAFQLFYKTLDSSSVAQRYVSLVLIAIKVYGADMTSEQRQKFEELKKEVLVSLKDGENKFARPKTYDNTISLLFPEMKTGISKEIGSVAYAERIHRDKNRAMIRRQHEEAAKVAAIEATKKAVSLEKEQADLVQAAIRDFCLRVVWMGIAGWPVDVSQAIELVKGDDNKYGTSIGIGPEDVIRSAWSARESATPIHSWLTSLNPPSQTDVYYIERILDKAWMIYKR